MIDGHGRWTPWLLCWLAGGLLSLAVLWGLLVSGGVPVTIPALAALVLVLVGDVLHVRAAPAGPLPDGERMPSSGHILMALAPLPWAAGAGVLVLAAGFASFSTADTVGLLAVIALAMHPMAWLVSWLTSGAARPRRSRMLAHVGMVLLFPLVAWLALAVVSRGPEGLTGVLLVVPTLWCLAWLAVVDKVSAR